MPTSPHIEEDEEREASRRRAFEARVSREARRFDLRPLIELLRSRGYAREDILFEGTRQSMASPALIESIVFVDRPSRRVIVTLNLGLLADGTLLPTYFAEVVDASPRGEAFYDFIRFFDHRLLENFLRAVYPEDEGGPFGDYERALRSYFRLTRPDSTSTLAWIFRRLMPDHCLRVERRGFTSQSGTHAFLTGKSLLDGTGILGRVYPWNSAGFIVTIIVEEETDERGRPWPAQIQARLRERILPLLEPYRIPLLVKLDVLNHASWVELEERSAKAQIGYLGYERIRGKPGEHSVVLYRGVPGE